MALTFTHISATVGIRDGKTPMTNTPADLAIVANLFDRIPLGNGGSAELFGVWSTNRNDLITEVTDQIVTFQKTNGMHVVDGVLDPGGATLKLMNKLAQDQLLVRMPGEPPWEYWNREGLPQLSHSRVPEVVWEMTFGGGDAPRAMSSRAYECDKALGAPHIGVGWPSGATPSAYLIYFHHSIVQERADYAPTAVRFTKGIGDYMIGRLKGLEQVSFSGKNVCLVVPEPQMYGQSAFENNEALATQALKEIDADLTGQTRDLPPLLLASYSDGLGRLHNFTANCPTLRHSVRAIYDFDGLYVTRFASINFADIAKAGVKVFRYVGNSSPGFLSSHESKLAYVNRCMSQSPKVIPLPQHRWIQHPHYHEFKDQPGWAAQWWMHIYIPTCMLRHGLATTDSI